MSENIERGGCLCGQFTYSFDRSAVQYSQGSIAITETVKSQLDQVKRRLHSFLNRLYQFKVN